MVCQFLLYNKVNQLFVYIYPHSPSLLSLPPTLPIPPSRSSQSIELISRCYAAASHQLSILHLAVYTCQCCSLTSSQLPLPPLCPQVRSLCLCLYSCPVTRFIGTVFLDSIYVCYNVSLLKKSSYGEKSLLLIWYTINEERERNWGKFKEKRAEKEKVSNIKEKSTSCFFIKESSSGNCKAT